MIFYLTQLFYSASNKSQSNIIKILFKYDLKIIVVLNWLDLSKEIKIRSYFKGVVSQLNN